MSENAPLYQEAMEPKAMPSAGEFIKVTAMAVKIYNRWKRSPNSEAAMPSKEEIAQLEDVGRKIGFNINIFAYANELLDGFTVLEPDLCKSSPKQAAKKFYEASPNISHILALDPNGGWKSIRMFMPASKEEEIAWIRSVFTALCGYIQYLKEHGKLKVAPLPDVSSMPTPLEVAAST